jgi:hypothetical protein
MNYQRPRMIRSKLPVGWHNMVRECLDEVETIAAVHEIFVTVFVMHRNSGDLHFSVTLPADVDEESESVFDGICESARDSIPFICKVCGAIGPCTEIGQGMVSCHVCPEHVTTDPFSVVEDFLPPCTSPWAQMKQGPVKWIATYKPASEAARLTDRRCFSKTLMQKISEAESLRARIAVDEITNQHGVH